MRFFLLVSLLFSSLIAIAKPAKIKLSDICHGVSEENVYLFEINDPFELTGENAASRWVKFVVLTCPDGKEPLVFHSSDRYPRHTDFLTSIDAFNGLTQEQVNQITLKEKNRRALYGVVTYETAKDLRYQVLSDDLLLPETVLAVQQKLQSGVKMNGINFSYSPTPLQRGFVRADLERYQSVLGVPVILSNKSSDITVYASGWSVGKVKLTTAAEMEKQYANGEISRQNILVLDEAPADVPLVEGVVTSSESSFFSHPALLSQMLGTIFLYEPNAVESPQWLARDNTNIFIQSEAVGVAEQNSDENGTLDIRDGLSDADVRFLSQLKKAKPQELPIANLTRQEFIALKDLKSTDLEIAGSKAVNLSLVCNALNDCSPGFAVPFYFHDQFLNLATGSSGQILRTFVQGKLALIAEADSGQIKKILKEIRNEIRTSIIPENVWTAIDAQLKSTFGNSDLKLRFRSSSNIEDLKNFNGAGIYESEGAFLKDSVDVKNALRKVWASVYTEKAFHARREAGLEAIQPAMAVLVHPAYQNELANGVLVAHLSDEDDGKVTATGFQGEENKVTEAPPGKVPETTQIDKYDTRLVIPSSELADTQRVMTDDQYRTLYDKAMIVLKAWIAEKKVKPVDVTLDMEWKLMPGGKVVIKQARPVPEAGGISKVESKIGVVVAGARTKIMGRSRYSTDGLQILQMQFPVEMDLKTFELKEPFTNPVLAVRVKDKSGQVVQIPGSQIKASYKPGKWNGNFKEEKVLFAIPHPTYPSFKIEMTFTFSRADKSTLVMKNPIKSVAHAEVEYQISGAELVGNGSISKGTDKIEAEVRRGVQLKDPTHQTPVRSIKGNGISIKFIDELAESDSYDARGMDYFVPVDFEIEGLVSQTLRITKKDAMAYGAEDHNCCWSYAFDLFQADGMTDALKAELNKKGGRYIVISNMDLEDEDEEGMSDKASVKIVNEASQAKFLIGTGEYDSGDNFHSPEEEDED